MNLNKRFYSREITDTGLTFIAIIPDSSSTICRFRVYNSSDITEDRPVPLSLLAIWDVVYVYNTNTLWEQFYYKYHVEPEDKKYTLLSTDNQGYTCFGVSELDVNDSAIVNIWSKLHDILDEFRVEQLLD